MSHSYQLGWWEPPKIQVPRFQPRPNLASVRLGMLISSFCTNFAFIFMQSNYFLLSLLNSSWESMGYLYSKLLRIFPEIFLLLISNLVSLWPESIFCMNSIFFNILSLVLWPRKKIVFLSKCSCVLNKNVYSAIFG